MDGWLWGGWIGLMGGFDGLVWLVRLSLDEDD
jgi:hypothetical protein